MRRHVIFAICLVVCLFVAGRLALRESAPSRAPVRVNKDARQVTGPRDDLIKALHPPAQDPQAAAEERRRSLEISAKLQQFDEESSTSREVASATSPATLAVLALPDVAPWLVETRAAGVLITAGEAQDPTDPRCRRVSLFRLWSEHPKPLFALNGRWRVCPEASPVLMWREDLANVDAWLKAR